MDYNQVLRNMFEDGGEDFNFYDREWFQEKLDDSGYLPTLQFNLFVIAYDAEVFEDVSDADEIDQLFYVEHIKTLTDDYGLTIENAEWVVATICYVFGEEVLGLECDFIREIDDYIPDESLKPDRMEDVNNESNGVLVSSLEEGDKLPKDIIERVVSAENKLGIKNMSVMAMCDCVSSEDVELKIIGEITSDNLRNDCLIYVKVYNDNEEVIGASINTLIETEKCNGFVSFSTDWFDVPKGETISKIIVRPDVYW